MRVCAAGGTLDGDGAGVGCVAGRSVLALLETKNDDDDRGEQTGFLPERLMVWLVLRLTGFRSNHWGLLCKKGRFETYLPVGTFRGGWYVYTIFHDVPRKFLILCRKSAEHVSPIKMTGRVCSISWWVPKRG